MTTTPSIILCKRVPESLWNEILEFIEDHVDTRDGELAGEVLPNKAMSLMTRIEMEVK